MKQRTKIIIAVAIVLLFIVLTIVAIVGNRDSSGDGVEIITDVDTGEVVLSDSNKYPDYDGTPRTVILGAEKLVESNLVTVQISFIRDQISLYNTSKMDSKYKTITIIPQDYKDDGQGNLTGRLRLGQGEDFVNFIITARNTGESQVIIKDTSKKYGGDFDSGLTVFEAD